MSMAWAHLRHEEGATKSLVARTTPLTFSFTVGQKTTLSGLEQTIWMSQSMETEPASVAGLPATVTTTSSLRMAMPTLSFTEAMGTTRSPEARQTICKFSWETQETTKFGWPIQETETLRPQELTKHTEALARITFTVRAR